MTMTPDRPDDSSQDPLAKAAGRRTGDFGEDFGAGSAPDRRLETMLDESLTSFDPLPELPSDFTDRVVAARPFAPWEVRRASFWKVPALVAAFFFASSIALFVTPLLRLETTTALTVWFRVLVASVGKPVVAILLGAPLLADAGAKLAANGRVPSIAFLAGGAFLSAGVLLVARRWRGLARTGY
jgi:hypothetical protein